MTVASAVSLLKKTYNSWTDHHAPRLGASVAFYTILSLAPLLILTLALAALAFDPRTAQAGFIDQARQMIGERGADTVKSLLSHARKPASGVTASIIAFVTLLFGASGVFSELRDALNIIWDADPKNESGVMGMIKQRLFSFGMVLSVGFIVLVSFIISGGLAFFSRFFSQLLPLPSFVLEIINFAVSFIVISVLFALLFKFVPARPISWRDVRVGAIGTAILFTVGKFFLGLYLRKASVGSPYGAAGSLVAVIVWVYYSAQIFFFGAEFTRVYANSHLGTSLPITKTRKAAGAAVAGGIGYSPAPTVHRSPSISSASSVNSDHPHSKGSLVSAAVSGFLVLRALVMKHRHRSTGS